MRKAPVALSINFSEGTDTSNSSHIQYLAFLIKTLRAIPEIGQIYVIHSGDSNGIADEWGHDWPGVQLVSHLEVTYSVDLIIDIGGILPAEWLCHVKAMGTKVAAILLAHVYPSQAEAAIFDTNRAFLPSHISWDEIWLLHDHMRMSGPLLRTVTRRPVHAAPHLWASTFVDACAQRQKKPFGYKPAINPRPWRAAIFEPNTTVTKTSFIPMLICDAAYRKNNQVIENMTVINTFHMKEHLTFNRFASSLDLTKDHKATYEPRINFVECMANSEIDVIISHHWGNCQDDIYFGALHGGYPLIHNSEHLNQNSIGFYYDNFSASQGAGLLIDAWSRPIDYWVDYRERSNRYLKTLHPTHPNNVYSYRERVLNILQEKS